MVLCSSRSKSDHDPCGASAIVAWWLAAACSINALTLRVCLCFVCMRDIVLVGCVAVDSGFQVMSEGCRRLWVGEAPVGSGLLTTAFSTCAMCYG